MGCDIGATKQATRPLVLITGAAGIIGTALRPSLRRAYRLRLLDRQPLANRAPCEEFRKANIKDFVTLQPAMDGVDAVIHLAAEARADAPWEAVRGPNIEGTYNVFEAARGAGVRKVVFASSNHVSGGYDEEQAWPLSPDQPVRPDGPYGVSKAFGEALGRYYSDAFGISVICLRIGWYLEQPFDERSLRMWISGRDLAQLVRRSLASPVRYGLYYGVSNNTRRTWEIENARRELAYQPVDDSERFAGALGTGGEWSA